MKQVQTTLVEETRKCIELVGDMLKYSVQARNDTQYLYYLCLRQYVPELTWESFKKTPKVETLVRQRRKIQNELGLYRPSAKARQSRLEKYEHGGATMNTISMDKKYATRSGLPVRLLCVDQKSQYTPYCVVGLITVDGEEYIRTWTIEGKCIDCQNNHQDLIKVKEKKKSYVVCYITDAGRLVLFGLYDVKRNAEARANSEEAKSLGAFIHEIEYEV